MNTKHKQVMADIGNEFKFEVDEGLEDIITALWRDGCVTSNSCIDNMGNVWIEFPFYNAFELFAQLALYNDNDINGEGFTRFTLWNFIVEYCEKSTVVYEDGYVSEDTFFGNGLVEISFGIRFDKELLGEFKDLFFEVFGEEGD